MLLLALFLLPIVFVTGIELTINNHIVKIEDGILKNVEPIGESLTELDLSGLALSDIDDLAFRNATNLTTLNLANNTLSYHSAKWLKLLVNLKNLSLANNDIIGDPHIDYDGNNLETVDLSNNPSVSLYSIGNFGLDRCDFIVKGTCFEQISYGDGPNPISLTTPKPRIPVIMSMYDKCVYDYMLFVTVDADTNGNITLADEQIKCPKLEDPNSVIFNTTRTLDIRSRVEVCIENGTLQRLSTPIAGYPGPNCEDIGPRFHKTKVDLTKIGIENFTKGWFHAESSPIHSIDLSFNKITLTSNLLNDLPESVKHVRLSGNKIKRLDNGIIQNEFLMYLDLSDNGLDETQSNALDKTNLSGLILARNKFTDTRFVENLPSSLTELYLNENDISQVSANSFSKLRHLFHLDLSLNKITQLGEKSLQGLSSLQRLVLFRNDVRDIESGAFRDLGELRELDLGSNNMTEFKESVFSDLRELIFLYVNGNNVKRVTKDTFKGLPDNLRVLVLANNGIESLEKDSFVRVPKFFLDLDENAISKIERGVINIPSLKILDLNKNKLSEIKEENFGLPNLRRLGLKDNLIGKLEKGAFRNMGNLEFLYITGNPIKTLQKGSLFGMNPGGNVYITSSNLELIQGGAFLDE